jgi:PTS system fructose-specific IIC component
LARIVSDACWFGLNRVDTIADYSNASLVIPEAKGLTAEELIAELCEPLEKAERLNDRAAFAKAVLAREMMSPTVFPPGWALPHARLSELPQLSFGLARTTKPISWTGCPGIGVRLVWLFAVPERETKAYLNLIASIAKLSRDTPRAEQLIRAVDACGMYAILEQVPVRRSGSPQLLTGARPG